MSTAQKILVADDSLTIRKLVENVLCQEGYEVITAETGADCLALAATQKPNLILLDYILPDKQGTEICRELINSPETWEIPVLMMSSNGNAIRQLYQDLNNVADYLTKPFAPSVLTAVVGHLLQREKPEPAAAEAAGTSGETTPGAAPVAAKTAVPAEFMDKVSRLLELIENRPPAENPPAKTDEAAADANGAAPAAATARPKARRTRKAVVSVPPPNALLRKVRLELQKHLRARLRQVPDWDAGLERGNAEQFFLDRLLAKEMVCDLAADLVRATGMPPEAPGALRCSAGLVSLDTILRHLHNNRATGELRIETIQETVVAMLQLGEIVFLTTNNPRNYCAGAACDFQSVPHAIIGEAVRAQEEQSVPFFISLNNSGHLPAGASLEDLLVRQGKKCLVRAFKVADATIAFFPLTRLPTMVRGAKLNVPFNRLLLACYRSVDDWFTLERAFTEMDATFVPVREMDDQIPELQLETGEDQILKAVRAGRTITELGADTGLKPFEVCRILFRFIKLGLVRNGPRRDHDERVDDDLNSAAPASTDIPAPTATLETPAEPAAAPALEPAVPVAAAVENEAANIPPTEAAPVAAPAPAPAVESDAQPDSAAAANVSAEAAMAPVETPAVPESEPNLAGSNGGNASAPSETTVSASPEPVIAPVQTN